MECFVAAATVISAPSVWIRLMDDGKVGGGGAGEVERGWVLGEQMFRFGFVFEGRLEDGHSGADADDSG